jgi:very-short-patch-repair endonuclease
MRAKPTWTEAKLWDQLRLLSVRFRRQAPMGPYVADFVCHRAALVIEVDGGVHDRTNVALRDLKRDTWFEGQGYTVIRIPTRAVETDLDAVVTRIRNLVSNRIGKVI